MAEKQLSQAAQWDHEFVWHPFTQMQDWLAQEPVVIERGEGVYLIDENGKKYYDGVSSLWVNIHGHNHPVLNQALKEQVDKIAQGQVWLGQDAQKNGLVDELGDIDVAIDKVVALVNQHPDKYMDNFSVQWLVDEDNSFLAKLDRKLKQKGQALLTNWLGLPQEVHQVKKQLNVLTKFNDPKGQYLYCLNCGSVK